MISIFVYCGSRAGNDSRFVEAARRLGSLIGERGCKLVYGGGHAGLLDTAGYFAPLRAMVEHTVSAGFVDAETIARLRIDSDPQRLLDHLLADTAAGPGRSDFSPI